MTKQTKFGPAHSIPTYVVRVVGEYGCTSTSHLGFAISQVDCYRASRPTAQITIHYSEACGHCRGSGRVCTSRRTLRWAPCPVCKGSPETFPEELVYSA